MSNTKQESWYFLRKSLLSNENKTFDSINRSSLARSKFVAHRKHGIAGCTAGLAAVLILHPLDVIKTRLQGDCSLHTASLLGRRLRLSGLLVVAVQDGVQNILPAYRGTVHAIKSIIAEEGWRALYSGLTPALFGAGELQSPCISAKHLNR